jgi:hypothetical protein
MPIFKVGNFDQIGVTRRKLSKAAEMKPTSHGPVFWDGELPLGEEEISISTTTHRSSRRGTSRGATDLKSYEMDLIKSEEKWGLFLKSISLFKSFDGIRGFNLENEIYFSSIAWDYSGKAPLVYPLVKTDPSKFYFAIKKKDTRQFIGDGVALWPSQRVVGCLNVVIFIFESDEGIRDAGKLLGDIHGTVNASDLSHLVLAIPANPGIIVEAEVAAAVGNLVDAVGKIMKSNKNDYVDLFQGSYRIDRPPKSEIEKYNQENAGIELQFVIS